MVLHQSSCVILYLLSVYLFVESGPNVLDVVS